MSLPLPVLPKPSGVSAAFDSFSLPSSLASFLSCLVSSSTSFSSRWIRSSNAFSVCSSAIASSGAPPKRQSDTTPMIANRRMVFPPVLMKMKLRTIINIILDCRLSREYLCAQERRFFGNEKALLLREGDDVGGHDLEVDRGADRVHRGGGFAAVEMLA